MCNFIMGECFAFGKISKMSQKIKNLKFPGMVKEVPLLFEEGKFDYDTDNPFSGYGFILITQIPDWLETYVVSRLSAALSSLIEKDEAIVELNTLLPFVSPQVSENAPFSSTTQSVANQLRNCINDATKAISDPKKYDVYKVAVLDTGFNSNMLRQERLPGKKNDEYGRRKLIGYDCVNKNLPESVDIFNIKDPLIHGSLVCQLLNAVLPPDVPLVFGRVTKSRSELSVLCLARYYAHVVALDKPRVVNLSLAPISDHTICPKCDEVFAIGGFHTLMLPMVFKLAANAKTWTVMAAGNNGRACNADHVLVDSPQTVFATALGSTGLAASYSNYVSSGHAHSLSAFGGDAGEDDTGQGILTGTQHVCGTSFAAPFVSAAIWAFSFDPVITKTVSSSRSMLNSCHP